MQTTIRSNWQYAREVLKKEGVKTEIITDYHDGEHGSLITMPDGDVIGCSYLELKDRYADAESYAVAKAFRLLAIFKKKGYIEVKDTVYIDKDGNAHIANG